VCVRVCVCVCVCVRVLRYAPRTWRVVFEGDIVVSVPRVHCGPCKLCECCSPRCFCGNACGLREYKHGGVPVFLGRKAAEAGDVLIAPSGVRKATAQLGIENEDDGRRHRPSFLSLSVSCSRLPLAASVYENTALFFLFVHLVFALCPQVERVAYLHWARSLDSHQLKNYLQGLRRAVEHVPDHGGHPGA